jgi:solute carrier family 35 protein E3
MASALLAPLGLDPEQALTFFYMMLNMSSSVGIVFVNKLVFVHYGFNYATTLTCFHFFITFIGLLVCARCGLFEAKTLQVRSVLKISSAFCGFVVLTNLSLRYNSVGFYQVMKVLTTPYIVVVEYLFYGKSTTTIIKASLAVICIGASITSTTDYQLNLIGALLAIAAIVVTSHYQIWVGTEQKELGCNSQQLLLYQAPVSACMLLFVIPCVDEISGKTGLVSFFEEHVSVPALACIFATGVISFFVNLSIFLVIGRASPVTYNVLGHLKLSLVILGGFVLFDAPLDAGNLAGVALTLTGVIWYTYLKLTGKGTVAPTVQKAPETEPLATDDSAEDGVVVEMDTEERDATKEG